ncbi:Ada metal-binding domain-containing protein [Acetoanaerobium noterae]|uniref:Ada metal-binding domain-containing protein n=1 Tax=Acetoanaerobium noterae TaxID=745369 RepID=UPI0028A6210D|nr:Ada metal-binding domain-containing protein [Acetoanaerobium noterae]
MKKLMSLLVVFMMLSLVACSSAPDEYVVSEPETQEEVIFEEEMEELEEVAEPVEETPAPVEASSSTQATQINYVGNANSYKFHEADCSSVDQMNESNKVFMGTREEAIDRGFEPCKRCNP